MTLPMGYPSPDQLFREKSEYARKGIARGRSVVVQSYTDGLLFVAENPSTTLHKISEIYDRIAFAAVGKYNEFENLRVAGVRLMDQRGYMYDRRDVTGRALANAYAQTLGAIFTDSIKPYEVEIVVGEVGETAADDQIYRLTYDGSIGDERGFVAIGGQSEQVSAYLREHQTDAPGLADALRVVVSSLVAGTSPTSGSTGIGSSGSGAQASQNGGGTRTLTAATLEVAVLDRTRSRRLFKRIVGAQLEALLTPTADS
ncbi:MAG: proteasome subunit alpha [Frankia sp.]